MSDVAAYHVLFPVQEGMWTGCSRHFSLQVYHLQSAKKLFYFLSVLLYTKIYTNNNNNNNNNNNVPEGLGVFPVP